MRDFAQSIIRRFPLLALNAVHIGSHRGRLALSTIGIGAGVTLVIAVSTLSASLEASAQSLSSAVASTANVEVRSQVSEGLDHEALNQVRDIASIEAAGAAVESFTMFRHGDREVDVFLLGIDGGMLELLPEAIDRRELADADLSGLFLPSSLASELGVGVGDRVDVSAREGWRAATISGIVDDPGLGRLRVAVGVLPVVQTLLTKGSTIDVIYARSNEPSAAIRLLTSALGDDSAAGPPGLQYERTAQIVQPVVAILAIAAIVALFVGAFLVFNTMSMAAVERTREVSILATLGLRRWRIFSMLLLQGSTFGLIGSVIGIGAGVVFARVLLYQHGTPLEQILPVDITRLETPSAQLLIAGLVGVAASVAASALPSQTLARSEIGALLVQVAPLERRSARRNRLSGIAAASSLAPGIPLALFGMFGGAERRGYVLAGTALTLLGATLALPRLIPLAVKGMLRPIGRVRRLPSTVRIAISELVESPSRTTFTVGSLFLALTLVVGIGIALTSFGRFQRSGFDELLRGDLYVRVATWRPYGQYVPVDSSLTERLEAIEGVRLAYEHHVMLASISDETVLLVAQDFGSYARMPALSPQRVRAARTEARLLEAPDSVLVSPSFLSQRNRRIGDTLVLPTPRGDHRFTIRGTSPNPGALTPEVYLDYDTYTTHWGANSVGVFPIVIQRGVAPESVAAAIEQELSDEYGVVVDTRDEFIGHFARIAHSVTRLVGSLQLIAVTIAALGIANTLVIATLHRRRDFAVLRAIGMRRRQIAWMIVTEGVLIGLVGTLLAWIAGTALGIIMHWFISSQIGMPFDAVLPLSAYAISAALGVIAAVTAAVYPGHRASRGSIAEALQHE